MADWNQPTLSSLYTDVLDTLKNRDLDAGKMQAPSANIPTDQKRYDSANNKFQNWNGSSWVDLVLSIAGGGTGSSSASGARTNLGLGTIAVQNANAVTITGGTISGLTSLAVSGNVTATGTMDVGNLLTADGIVVDASDGLPAAVTANAFWAGGFSSPATGRLYIGDGSGKKFFFSTRTGSVDSDIFELRDVGRLIVKSAAPIIEVEETGGTANQGTTGLYNEANIVRFYTINDAKSAIDEYMQAHRESGVYNVDRLEIHTSLVPKERFGLQSKTVISLDSTGGSLTNQVLTLGASSVIELTLNAPGVNILEIGGITAGFDGQICIIRFVSITGVGSNLLLTKEDTGVTAANRLVGGFAGGSSLAIGTEQVACFIYSTTNSRWNYLFGNV